MENNRDFKVLTDREHVLVRSNMYIGSTKLIDQEQWILNQDTQKFEYKQIKVVPALLKILNEIIDNSIDVAIDTNFKFANKIQVKVDEKSVTVVDNGIGIPVKVLDSDAEKRTMPEIAWTTLRSGTSFGSNREKIGTNGLGSVATNIFSKTFIATSDDGKHQQTITCHNNMSDIKVGKIKPTSGKSGVTVTFEPDIERFGLEKIDELHQNLIYQRLVNLAISFPQIAFSFNGHQIRISNKKFAQMFSENANLVVSDNTTICVFPNEYDEFKFYAQVNGLNTFRGGSHVDFVANEVANRVRDKLIKKYKTIRPGDIKNKLCIAVIMTGFNNPEFDSQTKESLKNSFSDVNHHINGKIDFDAFAKQILHNDAIIEPIIETFKIKEELKARQELKRVKKIKVKSDKYLSPIGVQNALFLCEGHSAMASLCSCLGRNGNAFYACRGLSINVLTNSIQKIAANQEFKDIMNVLELDLSLDKKDKTISFDKVVIACDADLDGIHLSSMLIGWFRKFAPNLFKEGKVCKLQTPLVIIKDNKDQIKDYFFTLDEFKKWEANNPNTKFKIIYQKGLGSMERSDINWLIANKGLDHLLYSFDEDSDAFKNVDLWLGADAEPRKEKLKQYTLDINLV